VRLAAALVVLAACGGAPAAQAPLANRGGAFEPESIALSGEALMMKGGMWLDRVTPATVTVSWPGRSGEGMVSLDGKVLGSVPQTFVVPAGHHRVDFELPGME